MAPLDLSALTDGPRGSPSDGSLVDLSRYYSIVKETPTVRVRGRVTELTGFASMVVNPFENMKLGSAVREAKLRREASSYLTACGLAMRRFAQ